MKQGIGWHFMEQTRYLALDPEAALVIYVASVGKRPAAA